MVIVGASGSPGNFGRARSWTLTGGGVDFTTYLLALGAPLPPMNPGEALLDASGVSDDGRTIVGAYANGTRSWVARMPQGFGCYVNCDESTALPVLNILDMLCFLRHFAAGDTYANCDGSTAPPVLNVSDFTCFLQKFAAGCP